jgi:hypothetical protein
MQNSRNTIYTINMVCFRCVVTNTGVKVITRIILIITIDWL